MFKADVDFDGSPEKLKSDYLDVYCCIIFFYQLTAILVALL